MPELPEVETTRRGLLPHVVGRRIEGVVVRDRRLRWPVPKGIERRVAGATVRDIRRRGKYLLLDCGAGHLLIHLGMSGRLVMVSQDAPAGSHDHVDLCLEGRRALRLTDPRRFGAFLWVPGRADEHALLRGLGMEPLEARFDGAALHRLASGRRVAVKPFLMNSRIVTGVGNIYASEALFRAGIHPERSVGRISRARWDRLAASVRETLELAIEAGGTTLRDFASADGHPGAFQDRCAVYGRAGRPCMRCGTTIRVARQGQRSTFYCPRCQT
jgi:formamidopyrimidine-DNA glycosylase